MDQLTRLLSLVALVAGALMLTFPSLQAPPPHKLQLQSLWEDDLKLLRSHKKLHKDWEKIKEVEMIGGTPTAKKWVQSLKSPLKTNPKGLYKLEVLVLSWNDQKAEGAIVQYDLIDMKSGNLVWELGRTFQFKGK